MPGIETDLLALRRRVETLEAREQATGRLLAMLLKVFRDTHRSGADGVFPGHRKALERVLRDFEDTRPNELPPKY
jgi:hypothetical protein